jgi:hypothetical protein
MHPLMTTLLAEAMQDDRLRRAAERRRARVAARGNGRPASLPRLRAPWQAGWSARQTKLRPD